MKRLAPVFAALFLVGVGAVNAAAAIVVISTSVADGTAYAANRKLVRDSNGRLYSVRVGLDAITSSNHIFISRSIDQGTTWVDLSTSPIVHDRDPKNQSNPALAIDSAGGLHMVWSGKCQGLPGCSDSGGEEEKIQYSSSPSGGTKWTPWVQIPAHSYQGFEGHPQLIIDKNDELHVVWTGQDTGASYGIRYSSRPAFGSQPWSAYTNAMGPGFNPAHYYVPSITMDSASNLHLVAYGPTAQIRYSSKTLAAMIS